MPGNSSILVQRGHENTTTHKLSSERSLDKAQIAPKAAATTGIVAFDVPFLNIHDAEGLRKETEAAEALGYSCKLAIHPSQINVINAVFTPAPDQVAAARRIVAAFEQAKGGASRWTAGQPTAPSPSPNARPPDTKPSQGAIK
ncbi:MAG: hypothetical protein JO106_00175 [Mycobacterium sp.]|nr:hypothetical protein [Mycobacterium sp.]